MSMILAKTSPDSSSRLRKEQMEYVDMLHAALGDLASLQEQLAS